MERAGTGGWRLPRLAMAACKDEMLACENIPLKKQRDGERKMRVLTTGLREWEMAHAAARESLRSCATMCE
jgi:hypothetical protein